MKVLIGDDEPKIRGDIDSIIDWKNSEFEIIRESENEFISRREKEENKLENKKLDKNFDKLKESFLKDWMKGKIRSSEVEKDMRYLNIKYTNSMGLIIVKPLIKDKEIIEDEKKVDLLSYGIYNIARDIMNKFENLNVFIDSKKQVVILCDINPIKYWHGAVNELENMINKYLNINVVICASFLRNDPVQVNIVYKSLCNRLIDKSRKRL